MFQVEQRRFQRIREELNHHLFLSFISYHLHSILLGQSLQTFLRQILDLHSLLLRLPSLLFFLNLLLYLFLNFDCLFLQRLFFLLWREKRGQLAIISIDEGNLDLQVEFLLLRPFKADLLGTIVLVQFSKLHEDLEVGHQEASKPIVLLIGREEGEDVVISSRDGQDLMMLPLDLQVIIDRTRGLRLMIEDLSMPRQQRLLFDSGNEGVIV